MNNNHSAETPPPPFPPFTQMSQPTSHDGDSDSGPFTGISHAYGRPPVDTIVTTSTVNNTPLPKVTPKPTQKKKQVLMKSKKPAPDPPTSSSPSLSEKLKKAGASTKSTKPSTKVLLKMRVKDMNFVHKSPTQTTLTQCVPFHAMKKEDTTRTSLARAPPGSKSKSLLHYKPTVGEVKRGRLGNFLPYEDREEQVSLKSYDNPPPFERALLFPEMKQERSHVKQEKEVVKQEKVQPRIKIEKGKSSTSKPNITYHCKKVEKTVEVYDLTVSDEEVEDEKRECSLCGWNKCQDEVFGDYCMATVERYFVDDKMSANSEHAERVFVKAFNSALDFYTFQHTCTLSDTDSKFLYPPICVQNGSMLHALGWFERQKKEFVDYYQKRNVISRTLRMEDGEKKGKTWEEHEHEVKKRKYGGRM